MCGRKGSERDEATACSPLPHQQFVFHRHTNNLFSTATPTTCSPLPHQQLILHRHANNLFSTTTPTICSPLPHQQFVLLHHTSKLFFSTKTICSPPPHKKFILNHHTNNSVITFYLNKSTIDIQLQPLIDILYTNTQYSMQIKHLAQ